MRSETIDHLKIPLSIRGHSARPTPTERNSQIGQEWKEMHAVEGLDESTDYTGYLGPTRCLGCSTKDRLEYRNAVGRERGFRYRSPLYPSLVAPSISQPPTNLVALSCSQPHPFDQDIMYPWRRRPRSMELSTFIARDNRRPHFRNCMHTM
mmetsp:Transcript_3613/g.4919  ORF Transcript_3613/g.4919 Transcript_3613/m.4919 type:complete len:151 (-) Transcript_3613:725-1177(-)